ncbi:MAG: hypothetical protein K8R57_07035 [Verrucomicrobia bacterium]|nr:hypothetical protein [Verrucomicrobiota bacterium]
MKKSSIVGIAVFCILLTHTDARAAVFEWEAPHIGDHQMSLRCYIPDGQLHTRALFVLVPGLNGDGRGLALDKEWQSLAQRTGCALIALLNRGNQNGIYYEVNHWSGELFLKGLAELSRTSGHPELNSAPLGFWGHSAGGQWNYNFACWKPERTFAFIANKGGYYNGSATPAVRSIPALWMAGEKDTDLRIGNITSLYAENRRRGALWGLLIEPGVDHAVGRSKEIGIVFLEDALTVAVDSSGTLIPITAGGWLGDLQSHEIMKATSADTGPSIRAWLPGMHSAELWKSISQGVATTNTESSKFSVTGQSSSTNTDRESL